MQEMQNGFEMFSAWNVHMLASFADGKELFHGRVDQVIQIPNDFEIRKEHSSLISFTSAADFELSSIVDLKPCGRQR